MREKLDCFASLAMTRRIFAAFTIRCCEPAQAASSDRAIREEARPSIRLFGLLRALPAVLCGGIGPALRKR